MANTLTNLVPTLYEALDVVSRELVGFIPSVYRDSNAERAALNQSILSPVTPASSATDVTPGVTPPNDGDQTIGNVELKITKSRRVPIRWNGEEQKGINTGPGVSNILRDQFAQGMRTLCNEIETDIASLYVGASRAYGTAGTTPFASSLADTAQVRKILDDNGAPLSDRHMVIDTTAGAALRTLTQLTKANEAGDTTMLRQGVLLDIHGFAFRESAQAAAVAAGAGSGYLVNNSAGYAVGATSIVVDTGTGAINAGDVVTFAGDSNKYVVATGVSGAGTLVLAAPGLRVALADNTAITVGGNYTANLAFHRNAIALVTRAPALPLQGDMAADRMTITDPRSGLAFEVAMYPQYRQMQYELAIAWGKSMIKPEHTAILLG